MVVYCYDTGVGVYEIGENGDLIYKRTIPAPATMDNMWGRVKKISVRLKKILSYPVIDFFYPT